MPKSARLSAGAAVCAALFLAAAGCGGDGPPAAGGGAKGPDGGLSGRIFVYCAAGVKEPVSALAESFKKETGVEVELTFANSGQLLGQAEMTRTGDVYIPGDTGFIDQARTKGLVAGEPRDFCWFVPTILVQKGNPKGIKGLGDLSAPGMRLALADDTAAIGKLQTRVFAKNALDVAAIKKNVVASPATVTDTALTVKMKTADAAIVWDSTAAMFAGDAGIVRIPVEKNVIGIVASAVLASSRNRPAAEAFADYLASARGREVLRARGFTVEAPK